MSKANIEMIKALYASNPDDWVEAFESDAFLEAMRARILPLLTDDFEVSLIGPDLPGLTGTRPGFEGFVSAYREWLPTWASYQVQADDFIEAGDRVLVLSRWGGRTKTGDAEVTQTGGDLFSFLDGRIRRLDIYLRRHEALEAVGLSE